MKKLLILLMLASAPLGGCATIKTAFGVVTGATVTVQEVYIAANAYDAIEASATTYLKLPVCGNLPCRNPSATKPIVAAVRSGRLARTALEKAVNTTTNGLVNANLLNTLTSSTSTLKAILAEFGAQ